MILIPHGTLSEIGCIKSLHASTKKMFLLLLDFAEKPELISRQILLKTLDDLAVTQHN